MKKRALDNHIVLHYKQVVLYLNDITRIITLMEGANLKVRIIHEDFEYSSIEELISSIGKRLNQFKLIGSNEDKELVLIHFFYGQYDLAVFWSNIAVADAWNAIINIIKSSIDPWQTRLNFQLFNVIQLAILIINLLLAYIVKDYPPLVFHLFMWLWGFFLLTTFYALWYQNSHNNILLIKRQESGFVAKYGNNIVLIILGSVGTILVNIILQFFKK